MRRGFPFTRITERSFEMQSSASRVCFDDWARVYARAPAELLLAHPLARDSNRHHINTGKLVNELFGPGSEGVHRSRESVLVTMDMGGKLVPFAAESLVSQRMAVLHDFGSVVFVNYNEGERAEFLRLIRPYLTNPVAEPVVEEYAVVVSSSIGSLCELTPECLIVQRLDKETLTVIASPLAQTVALEHYENRVDAMVETFLALNAEVGRTGTLNMQRRELFSLVASNNFVLTECVSTLGVLDRSETAWRFARLDPIWELVRSEFDLKERFATLDFRLSQIQHNTRFFLEMQQSSKSNMLEIIVICLLSVEIVLTLLDLYQNRIEEARLLELEKTASSED